MDQRFLNAYIDPAPLKMLGRVIYPWCLKYRVRLTAFNSPLILGDRTITPADLMLAIKICAEEPIGRFGILDSWRIIRLEQDADKFSRLLKIFSEYVLVGHWPKFWEQTKTKGGNSSKGVPWELAVVANLIANGIPEKRAWEMPECQAIWYNSAFGIRNGADVAIISSEEEDFMQQQEDMAASNPAKETNL